MSKEEEILRTVRLTLDEMGVASGRLEVNTHLEDDLGLDSINRVDLAGKLAKRCKRSLIDKVSDMHTVGDIVRLLSAT